MISPAGVPDALIAQGRYTVTSAELRRMTGLSGKSLGTATSRLANAVRLFSPARGFYVVIPPEYRSWAAVPANWFVDDMMRHLDREYYVGFLSAAAFHGASHQAPQVFQVVTTKPLADRDFGRIRLRFITSKLVEQMPTDRGTSHTGYYRVSSREGTAVDLAWRPRHGAGLSNVATILKELGDLDGDQLARLAQLRDRATARRLGWLLNNFRDDIDLHSLRTVAEPEAGEPSLLQPRGTRRGSVDREWGVVVNTTVEPDV